MTHLLPGGGVPWVHQARSPVPPRLPHLATPRSVRRSATVVAGAYPLRQPPNAWSPGAPALLGSCYCLVTSGTPMSWRRGCLVPGLVRSAVRHYCIGRCSALLVCARRSQQVFRGEGVPICLPHFLCFSLPSRSPQRLCCGSFHLGVIFLRLLVRHSMRSACSAGSVRLPFKSALRASCVFGCAGALAVYASPRPGRCGAHRVRYLRRAPVGPFQAVRAPPRFLPRSRTPPF